MQTSIPTFDLTGASPKLVESIDLSLDSNSTQIEIPSTQIQNQNQNTNNNNVIILDSPTNNSSSTTTSTMNRRMNTRSQSQTNDDVEIVVERPNKRRAISTPTSSSSSTTTTTTTTSSTTTPTSNLPEQRTTTFRMNPLPAQRSRIESAMESKDIHLIKINQISPLERKFSIIGSTGNVYSVVIAKSPSCDCPDSQLTCKHIFFVYLRIFQLSQHDPRIWQSSLLSTEIQDIFQSSSLRPIPDNVWAPSAVIEKWLELTSAKRKKKLVPRKKIEGECSICSETFDEKEGDKIVYCKYGCGNNIHKACYEQWRSTRNQTHQEEATCVFCRAPWDVESNKQNYMVDGFLNLQSIMEREQERERRQLSFFQSIPINVSHPNNLVGGSPFYLHLFRGMMNPFATAGSSTTTTTTTTSTNSIQIPQFPHIAPTPIMQRMASPPRPPRRTVRIPRNVVSVPRNQPPQPTTPTVQQTIPIANVIPPQPPQPSTVSNDAPPSSRTRGRRAAVDLSRH